MEEICKYAHTSYGVTVLIESDERLYVRARWSEETQQTTLLHVILPEAVLQTKVLYCSSRVTRYCVISKEVVVVPKVNDSVYVGLPYFSGPAINAKSVLCIPITTTEDYQNVVGVIYLDSNEECNFDAKLVNTLRIVCLQYGKAIENSREVHNWKVEKESLDFSRKEKEALLRTVNEKYEELSNTIPNIIWVADSEGKIVWANDKVFAYTGLTKENYKEKWLDLIHPEDMQHALELWLDAVKHKLPYSVEYRMLGGNGQYEWFLVRALPSLDCEGDVVRWYGTSTNVQEQKILALEHAHNLEVQKSEKRYKTLTEAIPQLVWTALPNGYINYYNNRWQEYSGTIMKPAVMGFASVLHPDDLQSCTDIFNNSLLQHESFEIKCRLKRADGVYRWFLIRALPLSLRNDKDVSVESYFGTCTDIDDQQRAEESLIEARRTAEHIAELKSQWVANMSHEIRTPTNGILGMVELLLETQLSGEQRDYVETMHHSTVQLISIINDILDFRRNEAGHIKLQEEPFSPYVVLEEVCDILSPIAYNKGIDFAHFVDVNTVPFGLIGDPARLRQILVNLIGNSIKFVSGKEDRVVIRCTGTRKITDITDDYDTSSDSDEDEEEAEESEEEREGEEDGEREGEEEVEHENQLVVAKVQKEKKNKKSICLTFRVEDTGPGIPANQMDRLFEPFFQVDSSATRRHGGTGLGLAISRQLVDAFGGKIWVESKEGQGATFAFTINCDILKQTSLLVKFTPPIYYSREWIVVIADRPDSMNNKALVLSLRVITPHAVIDCVDTVEEALLVLHNDKCDETPPTVILNSSSTHELISRVSHLLGCLKIKQNQPHTNDNNNENEDECNNNNGDNNNGDNNNTDNGANNDNYNDNTTSNNNNNNQDATVNNNNDENNNNNKTEPHTHSRNTCMCGRVCVKRLVAVTTPVARTKLFSSTEEDLSALSTIANAEEKLLDFVMKPISLFKLAAVLHYPTPSSTTPQNTQHNTPHTPTTPHAHTHTPTLTHSASVPSPLQPHHPIHGLIPAPSSPFTLHTQQASPFNVAQAPAISYMPALKLERSSKNLSPIVRNMVIQQHAKGPQPIKIRTRSFDSFPGLVREHKKMLQGSAGIILEKGTSAESSDSSSSDEKSEKSKPVILVVEDNVVNLKVITRHLTKLGFMVDIAADGAEAVRLINEGRIYQLILMDLQMPEMDGFVATAKIREYEANANVIKPVPVIALTANTIDGVQLQCEKAGMNGYISKPVQLSKLMDTLRKFVVVA